MKLKVIFERVNTAFKSRFYLRLTTLCLFSTYTWAQTEISMATDQAYHANWDPRPLSLEEQKIVYHALDQPFYYLNKGVQSIAYLSQDGNYVLKCFKQKPFSATQETITIPYFTRWRKAHLAKKRAQKRDRIFTGYKIACDSLSKQTGVLYVHFNKTQNLSLSVLLLEPTGKTQYLCLDDCHFVLQRYAKSLNTHLSTLIASSDIEGAKQAIRQLLYLPLQFFEKNIRNRDLGFTNNYGFIDNKPVLLDAGKLVFSLDLKSQEKYQKKTRCFLSSFRSWIATSYPPLLSECDVVITEIVELLK